MKHYIKYLNLKYLQYFHQLQNQFENKNIFNSHTWQLIYKKKKKEWNNFWK